MSNRHRIIRDLPTTKSHGVIRIEVSYQIGGMNFWQGRTEPRGYFLSASPMEIGPNFVSFGAFTGVKEIIQEANRYSDKILNAIVPDEERIEALVNHVLAKNHLELA